MTQEGRRAGVLGIAMAGVLSLAYAAYGVAKGYSYWLDEIFAVTISASSWREMYLQILSDVHPPLYPIILKLWVQLWGTSEVATRSLSLLFAATTLILFARESLRSDRTARRVALLLISVSPAFLFYAQETRSYSMALALASCTTLLALRIREAGGAIDPLTTQRRWLMHASALALALTHYFGWIYVFVLSTIHLVDRRIEPRRGRTLLVLATMSLWPLWHLAVGNLGGVTGGNFWITVAPIVGTVRNYLAGCLLPLNVSMRTAVMLVGSVVAAALVMIFFRAGPRTDPVGPLPSPTGESGYLLIALAGMVILTGAIDLHTPMSTPRNFIVLLPATVLLIANLLEAVAGRGWRGMRGTAATLGTLALALVLARHAREKAIEKMTPVQNWKALATYAYDAGLCAERCLAFGGGGLHLYYFDRQRFPRLDLVPPNEVVQRVEELRTSATEVAVLGFHNAMTLPEVAELGDGHRVCLQPVQSSSNSMFVLVPQTRLIGDPTGQVMRACDR